MAFINSKSEKELNNTDKKKKKAYRYSIVINLDLITILSNKNAINKKINKKIRLIPYITLSLSSSKVSNAKYLVTESIETRVTTETKNIITTQFL